MRAKERTRHQEECATAIESVEAHKQSSRRSSVHGRTGEATKRRWEDLSDDKNADTDVHFDVDAPKLLYPLTTFAHYIQQVQPLLLAQFQN